MVRKEEINDTIIQRFYRVFLIAFMSKDTPQKSLFLPFIESASGKRSEILRKSVVDVSYEDFSQEDVKKLLDSTLIMKTDRPNCYTLTAKGLFYAEETIGLNSLNQFLDVVQDKYFGTFKSPGKLNDLERITLLSLIASRSFSISACMKVDTFGRENDVWMRIFHKSAEFLKELDLISAVPIRISGQSDDGQELPLSFIMRHMNHLQEKTKDFYSFTRSKCYYISLETGDVLSFEALSFLFSKVFDRVLTYEETERITLFINTIASVELTAMTEHEGKKYYTPEIDLKIESSLHDSVKQNF